MIEKTYTKIAVISDPQINLKENSLIHGKKDYEILQECLKNSHVDAFAVCGDITENGLPEEWDCFFDCFKHYCPTKQLFIVPGNMDRAYTLDGNKIFLDSYKKFTGKDESLYFSYETDKCMFVGISHEPVNKGAITDVQLSLLDRTIQKSAELDIPSIVLCHYQISNTINVNWKFACLNDESQKVRNILEKYHSKVIYFSGHIHRGLIVETGGSIITQRNVTYVSTPSICKPDTEHYQADNNCIGTGYILEIQKKNVRIRGFDFLNQEWLNKFDWTV